jgi:prophage tail gpP-like protein
MAEAPKDLPLTVVLEATESLPQRRTTNIESWSIDTQYLVPTDGFEFVAFEAEDTRYDSREWDLRPVTLELDGQQQLIGHIEVTEVGERGSAIVCRGRDWISSLIECNVDPTFKLRDDMTLEAALLGVCGPCGVTKIVDDADDYDGKKTIRDIRTSVTATKRSKKPKSRKADPLKDLQPKPGEGILEYCDRICARMGLTIQPGPDRQTLFITAPFYDEPSLYRPIRRYRDASLNTGNNVLRAKAVRNYSRMPTFALGTGTAATAGKKGEPVSKEIDVFGLAGAIEIGDVISDKMFAGRQKPNAGATGEALDAPKVYRLLYFRDEDTRTEEQLERAIRRAVADRMKDTLSYRVTVRGHKDPETDAIWFVDRMVQVEDELCGINEPLWIAKRTLRFDQTNGATTDLECWRPHSFPFFDETA